MDEQNKDLLKSHTSDDLSDLKQMFSNYQKKKNTTSSGGKVNREDILAKYFVPRKTTETFRILPPKPGKDRIEEAYFHVVPTTIAGGKTKYNTVLYCPTHNDPKVPKVDVNGEKVLDGNGKPIMIPSPCPLCEKYKNILKKQDPSIKGIKKENMNSEQLKIKESNDKIFKDANQWKAKKFYIIRGIDRGVEKDGVKFWRFKHNYRNQGTLDKLLPILESYMTSNQADYSDPINGTDLNIIMSDSEFMGREYKSISAIVYKGKSPLHNDPIVAKQWLDDDITWRDVFKPKKAPNITPYEFLEMVAEGRNPYWDDTDQSNKRWVFPGRPDLEEAANTRSRNLDAPEEQNIEMASDIRNNQDGVNINNVNQSNVGSFSDDAVDMGKSVNNQSEQQSGDANTSQQQSQEASEGQSQQSTDSKVNQPQPDDYDDIDDDEDLPF